MDTKLLEVFLAVVHTGSISAAARRLNFSQPAVSQQMKALERSLETPLFTREGGRIELTAAGRTLSGYAETTLSSWRFVTEQVREAAARDDLTEISVASFPSATAMLLPDALGCLLSEDASLRVKILDAEPPASLDLLRAGQCDALLSFSYLSDQPVRGFAEMPILTEDYVLMVPANHALAGEGQVPLEAAADANWIGGCPKCRHELVGACDARGFTPEIVCSTDDATLTTTLVARGVGVAMRPALNVVGQPNPEVSVLDIVEGLSRKVSIQAPDNEAARSTITLLHRALRTAAERLRESMPEERRPWIRVAD